MRNLKSIVLIAALSLTSAAYAVDTATTTDYNNANLTATTTGATAQAVTFTIPNRTLTIDTAKLKPGTPYTISIPVTNSTTDRVIDVEAVLTASGTLLAGAYTLTPVSESLTGLAAGLSGIISYTLVIDDVTAAVASKTLQFDIALTAVGTN